MAGRTPHEAVRIEQRRAKVAELYLLGEPQAIISRNLQVAQSTVSTDLKAIRQNWKESAIRDFDEARGIELAKIDKIEKEAWDAWQRSKEPLEETRIVSTDEFKRAEKKTRNSTGDSRFLDIVFKCVGSRRALLGLDAPTKISPTSPDGDESYHSHVMKELMRLAEEASDGPEIVDANYIEKHVQNLIKTSQENNE